MQYVFRYWQLVRLNGNGQCQTQILHLVQAWFNRTFAPLIEDESDAAEGELQRQLIEIWQTHDPDANLAQLALRCYITHQIRYVCLQLQKQFGPTYGFSATDLYPLVFNDDGQPRLRYQPFTLEILNTYDPHKARLNTWATQLTKNHPDLNRALLDKGLYRASDWAILNDTSSKQLLRILRQYHLCSEYEIGQAITLLNRYHEIYSRDRLQQRQSGQRGRCHPPTIAQLQQMQPHMPPKDLLGRLKILATQLRQYRIHARGGNPLPYQRSDPDWNTLPAAQDPTDDHSDHDQQAFLDAYRQAMVTGLDEAIAQAIQAHLTRLKKRRLPREQALSARTAPAPLSGLEHGSASSQNWSQRHSARHSTATTQTTARRCPASTDSAVATGRARTGQRLCLGRTTLPARPTARTIPHPSSRSAHGCGCP